LRIDLAATVRSSAVDERAENSSQATYFGDALLRYLSETTKRERRRRFFERGRWAILVIASVLACQWPDVRSNAAGAVEPMAEESARLAAFACPRLEALLTEHPSRSVSPERLRFAGGLLAGRGWAL
jgi:hypothetical protein